MPVIVEHCPADKRPTAQIIKAVKPYWLLISVPALNRVILTVELSGSVEKVFADTVVTNKFMMNAKNNDMPDSMPKYLFAS